MSLTIHTRIREGWGNVTHTVLVDFLLNEKRTRERGEMCFIFFSQCSILCGTKCLWIINAFGRRKVRMEAFYSCTFAWSPHSILHWARNSFHPFIWFQSLLELTSVNSAKAPVIIHYRLCAWTSRGHRIRSRAEQEKGVGFHRAKCPDIKYVHVSW